ncbi:hypothetical protein [Tritonibacter scottomollicae]|uniref:hypothetical protein n=1 Tax=Tritonibacter scottomollicae TaxID=483013 RepID=UPI001056FCBE|nr:hypothetical protein [Tritonibacter scottomollicae]
MDEHLAVRIASRGGGVRLIPCLQVMVAAQEGEALPELRRSNLKRPSGVLPSPSANAAPWEAEPRVLCIRNTTLPPAHPITAAALPDVPTI